MIIKLKAVNGELKTKITRVSVNDKLDEVTINVPKIEADEVNKEFDKFATALRKLDTAIQEANWKYEIDFKDSDNPMDSK